MTLPCGLWCKFTGHPPDEDFEAGIATLDEHWQGHAVMLRHTKSGGIGASRAGRSVL